MNLASLIDLLPGSVLGYLGLVTTVVTACAVIATAISKATKNTTDDKIAGWLVWFHDVLVKFVPSGATLAQKRTPAIELPPTVHSKRP